MPWESSIPHPPPTLPRLGRAQSSTADDDRTTYNRRIDSDRTVARPLLQDWAPPMSRPSVGLVAHSVITSGPGARGVEWKAPRVQATSRETGVSRQLERTRRRRETAFKTPADPAIPPPRVLNKEGGLVPLAIPPPALSVTWSTARATARLWESRPRSKQTGQVIQGLR